MSKFKVGDRVRVVNTDGFYRENKGLEGVIIGINGGTFPIRVEFDSGRAKYNSGRWDIGLESDLELVKDDTTEYLIEDVIKLMRENPERKFKTDKVFNSYIKYDVDGEVIKWKSGITRTLGDINVIWTEYFPEGPIKPMTFMEIVEIISEYGNNYKVETETANQKYINFLSDVLMEMADKEESRVMSRYMKGGEWYLVNPINGERINYKGEC